MKPHSASKEARPTPRIIIIGAGLSGILMGIKLKADGLPFTILEKAEDLGGTWRDNRYPGIACDVPAHLYVYSFWPNPKWSKTYAPGSEILQYYRQAADHFGITPHIRYSSKVVSARWEKSRWAIETAQGERLEADILITAISRLHHPFLPKIEGLDEFDGPVMHSARWQDGISLHGLRVGIVGTGSTSAQLVSALADQVSNIVLFQRTPQWVIPIPNHPIPAWKRMLLHLPRVGKWYHRRIARRFEKFSAVVVATTPEERKPRHEAAYQALTLIKDGTLRQKLTPDYEPGCKRMVISDTFHAAIQKSNVELVTSPIDRVEERAIRTKDGVRHEVDNIVLATGFVMDTYLSDMNIVGKGGTKLQEYWQDTFQNYLSVAIPGFPNFFMIGGPLAPLAGNPVVSLSEIQVGYVMQLVNTIVSDDVTLEAKEEAAASWTASVRGRARKSAWGSGCHSYYLDKHGVPTVNPQTLPQTRAEMGKVIYSDFLISSR